jgi:hypothetical protein
VQFDFLVQILQIFQILQAHCHFLLNIFSKGRLLQNTRLCTSLRCGNEAERPSQKSDSLQQPPLWEL